jgi:methionyl aminopeptidase
VLTKVKTDSEIQAMRYGGRVLAKVLEAVAAAVKPGINGAEVNAIAEKELVRHGVKAAFLGFEGFPASICLSINDEVVHGIPTADKVVKNQDLVSLDLGVAYKGLVVDGAITMVAGDPLKPGDPKKKLLETTEASLKKGLSSLRSGCRVGDISNAIEKSLKKQGLGIVRELVGHGVGHELHEDPNIPNFGRKGTGMRLLAGMTIAVEPMATLGGGDVYIDSDNWTVRTRDKSVSAQFEHTVLVTDSGCEILTSA